MRRLKYPKAETSEWAVMETASNAGERHAFDLEERTAVFGEAIIRFVKRVPRGPDNDRLIDQLVGCGTSVGANYCEANEGLSRKDFHCIIGRCRKEAKKTKFFLRMIATAEPSLAADARELFREAKRASSDFLRHVPQLRLMPAMTRRYLKMKILWSLDLGTWSFLS